MFNAHRSRRKGGAAVNILLAMGLFAIVFALIISQSPEPASTDVAASGQDENPADRPAPIMAIAPVPGSDEPTEYRQTRKVVRPGDDKVTLEEVDPQETVESDAGATVPTESVDEGAVPGLQVEEQLMAHLAAGEFGPAMDLACSVVDAKQQARLLHLVSEAQLQAGEFHGALMSVRQMPNEPEKVAAGNDRARERSLAGGTAGADFGPLMDLILNQTTGPWIDIEGTGGSMSPFGDNTGGISVDPNGLMDHLTKTESGNRLASLGRRARAADLNEEMARPSSLRLVSLTRLEREVAARMQQGLPVVETMRNLAGLSSVKFVFVFPETGEVVIGGPAEPWSYNENGLAVAADSGRPILQLDDLVTVLRAFSDQGAGMFTCSIDPRQDGLTRIQNYLSESGDKPLTPSMVRQRVKHFQDLLGVQDVTIKGVPNDSRVASVIAEADYRMKLIGIDRLENGANIPSFFDLVAQNPEQAPSTMDALRWWLTMKYDAVLHSADRDVFEFQGSSVLCLSENEFVNSQGQRVASGQAEAINREFARQFTEHYSELAQQDPVFADLQNIFDLALVAALIERENLDGRAQWDRGVFASRGEYAPRTYDAPTTVMSVVNHRVFNGRDIVIQVAGGVRGDLMAVVKDSQIVRPGQRLDSVKSEARALEVPASRWWWDAR